MSTSTESLAQKWLRQNVQAYAFKDAVYSHVDAVLTQFNTIRPKTDVYTYDDGRTQLLLCLHGLLPIAYRGASYNIPIAVWITRDYPRQPPITYVVPTSDMLVRSGKYVDVSGRCNIEYLQNWEKKSEGCNLIILLEVMQQHFSRDPPVYAKPKTASNQQSQPQSELQHPGTGSPAYAARPPPPLPGTSTPTPLSTPTPMVSSRNDDRPPLPLKPGQQASSATPPVFSSTSTPPDVNHRPPATYATAMKPPPPLPRHPPGDPGLPQYRNSPAPLPPYDVVHDRGLSSGVSVTGSSATFNTQSHAMSPSYTPGRTMSSEIEQNRTSITPYSPPSSTPVTATPTRPPPPPPPPPPVTISHGPPHPPPPPQLPTSPFRASLPLSPPPAPPLPVNLNQSISPQATGPISTQTSYSVHPWPPAPVPTAYSPANMPASIPRPTPSIPPPDLLDAEDDLSAPSVPQVPAPAPPRPPNPELLRLHDSVHAKLSSELASLRQAMALDAERLRANQTDLLAGEPAIRDEMARLEAVRDVCRGVGERMKTVVEQATSNVADLKRRGDPSVDELVCSTTIVHDQLINLVAEDNAIEDTIYHLHRALNAGRIDLERFLRTTRILAEEQFMKRALIEKIQGGIPMGTESSLHVRPEWA